MATNDHGDDLERKLERVGGPACPSCGRAEWIKDLDRNPVLLPAVIDGEVNPGRGLDAFVLLCGACGFIRLHSLAILREID